MYVVTFYSFKGGVGRSMSLVNVGVQLAQSGRKVLLVDFDLEAPGLPTFSLEKPKEDIPGIVEYVSQYIATGESPDVKNFIYKSDEFASGGGLWVMPVGKQDAGYSNRLNSIDWRKLYSEQSGFLFMEDLKRQWAESIAPDYVLIDSRTGHSDIEGICTRQLPNAVCLLFFPNEQNLHGLKRIVANINATNEQSQTKKIKVHFAVSNVPDLDDEDQILGRTMDRFRKELGYKQLAAEIHHYNSLSLLNQEIFSLKRPNSRLTKEYMQLTKTITSYNLEDREVAIEFLKSARRGLKDVMGDEGPKEFEEKMRSISNHFPLDGEIGFRIALVFEQLGNSNDALSMLAGDAVEQNYATAPMFAARARLRHRFGRTEETVQDIKSMLDASGADLESFLTIVPLIDQLDPGLYEQIPNSVAFNSLSMKDKTFLAFQLEGSDRQLKTNVTILQKLRKERAEMGLGSDHFNHQLALASIGTGDFNTAIDIIKPLNAAEESLDINDAFNLAMAMWGRDKEPPANLFSIVIKKNAEAPNLRNDLGANYSQCLAISHSVLGNIEKAKKYLSLARNKIENVTAREFSAWSYSKVTPQVFLSHLDEIERFVNGEDVHPRYMGKDGNN